MLPLFSLLCKIDDCFTIDSELAYLLKTTSHMNEQKLSRQTLIR